MKRWAYWAIVGAVLLALAALIGWANAYTPLMVPSASEAWSRGRILGATPVNVRADIRPVPGGDVFLTWVDLDNRLHLAKVGSRGQILLDRSLSIEDGGARTQPNADGPDQRPREPRLLVGPGGSIHLVWRETSENHSLLRYARLDSTASIEVGPLSLSQVEDNAQSPYLAFNHREGVEILWAGRSGVYWVTLSAEGEMRDEPVLLIEGGQDVAAQVDTAGILHLVWLEGGGPREQMIYYATLDPESRTLSQPEEMDRIFLRAGQVLQGPDVGVDSTTGYVLWIVQDMKYVTSSAWYAFFPLEIPRQKKVRALDLEMGGNPLGLRVVRGLSETFDTSAEDASARVILLVALTETVMTPDGPQLQIGIIPLRGEGAPGERDIAMAENRVLPVAIRAYPARVLGDRLGLPVLIHPSVHADADDSRESLGTSVDLSPSAGFDGSAMRDGPCGGLASVVSQEGWPEDQYIVTASASSSLKPSLLVDARGDLHLSWLETGGFGTYRVAYASTASEVKQSYNALTLWDLTDRALGVAMQFFLAVGLTPVLAITWSLFPLMWLLGYHLVTGRETLATVGERVALGISVLLEVVFTYLIYPYRGMLSPVLQWTMPVATAVVAFAVAMGYLYLRRRDSQSLFEAFFIFAPVHGLLQVLLFVLLRG